MHFKKYFYILNHLLLIGSVLANTQESSFKKSSNITIESQDLLEEMRYCNELENQTLSDNQAKVDYKNGVYKLSENEVLSINPNAHFYIGIKTNKDQEDNAIDSLEALKELILTVKNFSNVQLYIIQSKEDSCLEPMMDSIDIEEEIGVENYSFSKPQNKNTQNVKSISSKILVQESTINSKEPHSLATTPQRIRRRNRNQKIDRTVEKSLNNLATNASNEAKDCYRRFITAAINQANQSLDWKEPAAINSEQEFDVAWGQHGMALS